MTIVARLVSLGALAAWALALGRWLRDPDPGAGLLGLVALAAVIALAVRRLHAAGWLGPRVAEPVAAATAAPAPPPAATASLFAGIDINRATVEELQALPGVGPVAAGRIVAEREAGGPFASVEALTRVPGFGPAKVRSLADRARV